MAGQRVAKGLIAAPRTKVNWLVVPRDRIELPTRGFSSRLGVGNSSESYALSTNDCQFTRSVTNSSEKFRGAKLWRAAAVELLARQQRYPKIIIRPLLT